MFHFLKKISKTPFQSSPAQWPKILVQSSTKLCQHRKFSKFPAQKDTICLNFSITVLAQWDWKLENMTKTGAFTPEILPKMIKTHSGMKISNFVMFSIFSTYTITQKSPKPLKVIFLKCGFSLNSFKNNFISNYRF